jgi:hypothetical protein
VRLSLSLKIAVDADNQPYYAPADVLPIRSSTVLCVRRMTRIQHASTPSLQYPLCTLASAPKCDSSQGSNA